MNRASVLLVDDDPDLLQLLTIRLRRAGFEVGTAASGREALAALARVQPDVVVTDLKMDDLDGLGLLDEIERRHPVLPVILITAHGTIPDAVSATRRGAFAFLTKPLNDEELVNCVRDAAALKGAGRVEGSTSDGGEWRRAILTRSSRMDALLRETRLAAASEASVIIFGESGTGKELLARAVHAASPRCDGPFTAVNCTAIPEALFESELFGHVKGSFSGAHRDRAGLMLQASGGTLFLDEIGDMPLAFQAKLLRALQERRVRAVGADSDQQVDVRIIAATHRDLVEAIATKAFREDLYYRLSVVTLVLPPLAERREDIPLLAHHFLKEYDSDGVATGFSADAMELLVSAPWPGNVRQLANVVHQCKVLSRTELVSDSLVERALHGRAQGFAPFAAARDEFEFDYLTNLLQITEGNVSQAARLAERNRSEFYKLLKRHDLDPSRFRRLGDDTVDPDE
jgi:two-component system response regulator GlrR